MKPKDFRNCYLSFVQLYGAIFSDDASNIIKIYFPDLKKSELINDLRSRCDKLTRGYAIIKAVKGKYVICDELYDYDDLDKLFDRQTDKPFFIPKTYEEFLKYQDYSFWEEQHKDELDGLQRFLAKRCDKPEVVTKMLFTHIRSGSLDMDELSKFIELFDVRFKDIDDAQKFFNIYYRLANNTKLPQNRGYSPNELRKMHPIDPNNVQLSIGPNMKEMFMSGEMNPEEYYQELMKSDLPLNIKQSMGDELLDIINKNKGNKA